MIREMYVSSTPHETKVALVEDDQLAELFFERENEYTLAGSIYKGRVTRVLPGMQSAFVDIGLERDAFLYVSDFLELPEDEENEFEEIAVTRPETFVTNRPPQETRLEFRPEATAFPQADRAAEEEEKEASPEDQQEFVESEDSSSQPGGDEQEFRGGRRRRRPRRRGFPDSKFAHAEDVGPEGGEGAPDHSPAVPAAPVLLPGESISKYQMRGETSTEAKEIQPARVQAEESQPPEREAHSAGGESPRTSENFPPQPIMLPGESIAKYQPRTEPPTSANEVPVSAPEAGRGSGKEEPGERDRRNFQFRDRTTATLGRAGGHLTLLPGESIAKYQSRAEPSKQPQEPRPGESERHAGPSAATFVIESEPWTGNAQAEFAPSPAIPAATEDAGETPEIGTGSEKEASASHAVPAPKAPFIQRDSESPSSEEPVASDWAAAPHGEAAEAEAPAPVFDRRSSGYEESGPPHLEEAPVREAEGQSDVPATETGPANFQAGPRSGELPVPHYGEHVFGASGTGTLEHEEIEGDEAEFHPPSEEESDSEFLELEEESFEREGYRPSLSERYPAESILARSGEAQEPDSARALPEPGLESAATSEAYAADENEEFESELSLGEEAGESEGELELPEEQQEEAIGSRAEVRGPGVTANYQRVERSLDRRRSRRFGRVLRRREPPRQHVQISDLLHEGQEVLVQIAKEPIGKKGARITSHIALPGRFLVYMPTVNHVGVSRKITDDEERQRLKRIMLSEREGGHGGFIVRTAAAGVGEDELRADIRFLKNLWAQIKQRAENGKAPALIYHDLNLVERILRDLVTAEFSQIWVDTEQEYERILNFANRLQPSLLRRVKLYTKSTPLFEQFGIHDEIDKALKSKVWLKSGGYIVINQTEALVAIDVNTGKYVGKTARLEDTIVKTNVDAIREIVRQIRLRDLGGIIVIDFIDMDERKNRQKVMQVLDEALKSDRSPSKVLAFNDFGLVAITRKRVKQSLERTLGAPCPYCTGTGFVKSVTTLCNEIYVELRKMQRHLPNNDVINLRVNPEIAKALKANGGRWLQDFEELTGRSILVKPDTTLHQEQFDIH
jgi:ribonuclease G